LIEHATGDTTDVASFAGSVYDWGRGQGATTLALAVFTGTGNDQDIYLFDLNTPTVPPRLVVQLGRHPSLSPEGDFIVYQEMTAAYRVVKRELDTDVRTPLHRGNNPRQPGWRK
jgi:hypothetical protein